MAEYKQAFVVGGWSEDHDFLEGLTDAVSGGPHRIVENADSVTLAKALHDDYKWNLRFKDAMVIAHSAGMMAVHDAGIVVALNGVEPTPLLATIQGGKRVALEGNITPDDEHVIPTGLTNGLFEVLRHPIISAKIPFRVRDFSTIRQMIIYKRHFPDGRIYLPTTDDEFGFGHHGEVDKARQHGILAEMVPGYHNQHLLRPQEGAKLIKNKLNEL